MGFCTCYFRCAEQAFPGGACHDEGSFCFDPGNDVHWLFHNGYPSRTFFNKYGYRQGVVFGLILYGIGSLLFIPSEQLMSFNFFLFSLFVIGCGLTFLETAANPYVTELGDRETAASRLNLAQSFNGLGCICAPVIGGMLLFSGNGDANIALPYTVMGVIVLSVALIFFRIRLPEINHDDCEDTTAEAKAGLKGLWKHRCFTWGGDGLVLLRNSGNID